MTRRVDSSTCLKLAAPVMLLFVAAVLIAADRPAVAPAAAEKPAPARPKLIPPAARTGGGHTAREQDNETEVHIAQAQDPGPQAPHSCVDGAPGRTPATG